MITWYGLFFFLWCGARRRDEVISGDDGETFDEMENGAIGEGPVKIVYTQRSRSGQVAEQTLLADVKDDFESRCVAHVQQARRGKICYPPPPPPPYPQLSVTWVLTGWRNAIFLQCIEDIFSDSAYSSFENI